MGVRWCVAAYVSTRGRNLFPSVLLQPLGHLSVWNQRLASRDNRHYRTPAASSSLSPIASGFSGLRVTASRSSELCQTIECRPIPYAFTGAKMNARYCACVGVRLAGLPASGDGAGGYDSQTSQRRPVDLADPSMLGIMDEFAADHVPGPVYTDQTPSRDSPLGEFLYSLSTSASHHDRVCRPHRGIVQH
jgi:hypothetical protein